MPKIENNYNEESKRYLNLARSASMYGTCDRRRVGACLGAFAKIDNRHTGWHSVPFSVAFNTTPEGLPTCDEVGHLMKDGHCIRTIHAEALAIFKVGFVAIKRFLKHYHVVLYTTTFPCSSCMNLIAQSGIKHVVYEDEYAAPSHTGDVTSRTKEIADALGINLEKFVK